jgi:hypothetical protein
MNISINKENSAQLISDTSKLRWKLYSRKISVLILIILLLGVLFLITGLKQGYDTSISDYNHNQNSSVINVHTVQYNYHPVLGLGIAFLLLTILITYTYLIKQKKQFFKTVHKITSRHQQVISSYQITINETGISYNDFETKREEKWSVFSSYKNHKGYLILYRDDLYMNCFVIDLKDITVNEADELFKFLKKRMIEKK